MDLMDLLTENMNALADGYYSKMVQTVFPVKQSTLGYTQDKFYSWRIFGSPFMLLDDPPELNASTKTGIMGEWYYSQLQQSQILTLKMGIPKYVGNKSLTGATDWLYSTATTIENGENVFSAFVENIVSYIGMSATSLNEATRQYIFYNQYELYIQYVRLCIISMAAYLGVNNFPVPKGIGTGTTYQYPSIEKMDWYEYVTNGYHVQRISELFMSTASKIVHMGSGNNDSDSATGSGPTEYDIAGGPPAIIQFVVSPTTAQDSFTNGTRQSSAAQAASSADGLGQEVAWVTGTSGSISLTKAVADTASGAATAVQGIIENMSTDPAMSMFGSSIIGMIRGLAGEKMIYPEIFDSSTFARNNLNYTIKLASPYGDNYSYFMNIGLPLCYILPMIAPLSAARNAYKMPFMCQAYVTGQVALPMAIIGTATISRGATGAMNKDGLPLEVEVNLGIKDLYSVLSVSSIDDPAQFLSNESLIEYIASYTGIDTWNKSLMNKYLSGKISLAVSAEGMHIDNIANRLGYNLGKWAAESLYMYGILNASM